MSTSTVIVIILAGIAPSVVVVWIGRQWERASTSTKPRDPHQHERRRQRDPAYPTRMEDVDRRFEESERTDRYAAK